MSKAMKKNQYTAPSSSIVYMVEEEPLADGSITNIDSTDINLQDEGGTDTPRGRGDSGWGWDD